MVLKILLKIWPALIPIALYLLWILVKFIVRKSSAKENYIEGEFKEVNDRKAHEEKQNLQSKMSPKSEVAGNFSLKNRSFVIVIYLSLIAIIISFLYFALEPKDSKNKAQLPVYEINLKNHIFYPNLIEVEKGQRFKLIVHNLDDTAEDFKTGVLRKDKIISGNSQEIIIIEIEKSGDYEFFGDFHKETAKGIISVQ